MIFFSNRRAYNGRLTIGRSKEGLPLVGFKYRKADDWLDLNSKQEGVRLVGFKYQKDYDWLDLNSKQEGVGFKYQKDYDWLDLNWNQEGIRLWDSNIRRATIGWIHNSIVRT